MAKNKKKKKKSKKGLIALIIILACLAAAYAAGFFLWQDKFLPNTFINDQNVGNMTAAEAEDLLLPHNTDYLITELEGKEAVPLEEFGYTLTFQQDLNDLIENQERFSWPLSFLQDLSIGNAVEISFDEDLLKDSLLRLDAFNEELVIDPEDAHIAQDEEGHYQLYPEVIGNRLDFDKTFALVKKSLSGGFFDIDLTESDCYLKPSVYSDDKDLQEEIHFIKAIGEETITIDLTGAEEVLDPYALRDFVTLDENDNLIINEEKLYGYVYELSAKYNTYLNERSFTNHDGKTITVGGHYTDDYGIDTYGFLMNTEATANILRGCILSRENQYMQPSWDVPALTRNDVNEDIGDTYIELSLDEQHLWYYADGKLEFDADVVTGLDTDERRTPWGVFRAYEIEKDCTLKGEMAGERWNTKVAFWISVTWTGCGIHDASWQPTFGGDWYKTGGSHGCINVTYDTAKYLYDHLALDTPIVIY